MPTESRKPFGSGAVLGVIGGMGPLATVQFMQLVIDMTDAKADQEHVDMLVANHATMPDRTGYIMGRVPDSPSGILCADARALERAGCSALAIPCNTAHYFWADVSAAVGIPVLNIVRESVGAAVRDGAQTVGILCTEGCRAAGVYEGACNEQGIGFLYPDDAAQADVNAVIYDQVKAGREVDTQMLADICGTMVERGCDALILACTELPVAYAVLEPEVAARYRVVDSLAELARASILATGHRIKPTA